MSTKRMSVLSFRYLTEPRVHQSWTSRARLSIPTPIVEVMGYLQAQALAGNKQANAILASGIPDASGNYAMENTSYEALVSRANMAASFSP